MRLLFFLTLLILLFQASSRVFAATPPAENILIIYYADTTVQTCSNNANGIVGPTDTYPQQLEAAFVTALTPLASSISLLLIHNGDNGISSELASQYPGKTLSNWCQVYDLRFLNDCDNKAPTSTITADTVTTADMALYRTYLSQGGSLFLQAEHHDFYVRNESVLQFINSIASSPIVSTICTTTICPDVASGTAVDNNPFTTNYNFSTIYNTLSGSVTYNYGGGIDPADYGSGLPLMTIPNLGSAGGALGGMVMGWLGPGTLNAPYSAGKLIASFETNAWAEATLETTAANEALQNMYAELSGCQHYSVTKTVGISPICVGSPDTFTICATNTGTTSSLTNFSISDTLATCLTYNSSSPSVAPSATGNSSAGSAGTLYWWTFSTISPGQSACVTINFTPNSISCP